jgi:hypothetical protein
MPSNVLVTRAVITPVAATNHPIQKRQGRDGIHYLFMMKAVAIDNTLLVGPKPR